MQRDPSSMKWLGQDVHASGPGAVKERNVGRATRQSFILLTVAGFAVVMTLLTPEIGLEEAFRTLGMTLAGSQLPARWAFHALIPSRTAARITAQITLDATATIAVIAVNGNDNESVDELG